MDAVPPESFSARVVAIARDRSVRVLLEPPAVRGTSTCAIAALSPTGNVLWNTNLGQAAPATPRFVILDDGTTVFRADTYLDAIDATGTLRWSNPLECSSGLCAYSAAADPSGALVALVGDFERIDVTTGKVVWEEGVAPPQDSGVLWSTIVLGPPGVVYGATFGGAVFAAADP